MILLETLHCVANGRHVLVREYPRDSLVIIRVERLGESGHERLASHVLGRSHETCVLLLHEVFSDGFDGLSFEELRRNILSFMSILFGVHHLTVGGLVRGVSLHLQ